jgi:Pyridoxamine 5'-phosphate oxidase
MPEREPTETTNLDRYGDPALPWSRARDVLVRGSAGPDVTWFLGTRRPDGTPHAAGVGALWHDGELYFTSSPDAAKAQHLAVHPDATLSARLPGIDVVFEGVAERVVDQPTLDTVVKRYQESGWPAEVDQAAAAFTAPYSAPSAGPPPWHLFRLRHHTVFCVAWEPPNGATRWQFSDD